MTLLNKADRYRAKRRKKLSCFHDGRCVSSAMRNANFPKMSLNRAAAAASTG